MKCLKQILLIKIKSKTNFQLLKLRQNDEEIFFNLFKITVSNMDEAASPEDANVETTFVDFKAIPNARSAQIPRNK